MGLEAVAIDKNGQRHHLSDGVYPLQLTDEPDYVRDMRLGIWGEKLVDPVTKLGENVVHSTDIDLWRNHRRVVRRLIYVEDGHIKAYMDVFIKQGENPQLIDPSNEYIRTNIPNTLDIDRFNLADLDDLPSIATNEEEIQADPPRQPWFLRRRIGWGFKGLMVLPDDPQGNAVEVQIREVRTGRRSRR